MTNEMMKIEIKEAIDAGERALNSLEAAQKKLSSASNWGLLDLFGGGMFSSMMKHSKINDASSYMEDAKRNLKRFQRELLDVNTTLDLNIDIGSFLSFADFFFDGFVADYMVQSKISKAREKVDQAIYMVNNMLRDLEIEYNKY